MLKLKNGYVINPDSFWRPSYRISPFNTSYTTINKRIFDDNDIDEELVKDFFGLLFFPCQNGRSAIALALKQYDLQPEDEVLILTTSGNKYISSCVTREIEKVCKWSRKASSWTKLIFVNHEFGFCYKDLEKLNEYNLPIIEDKALSFISTGENELAGKIGDFVIYSLPKFFPISFGGVLKCNDDSKIKYFPAADVELNNYFFMLMSVYLKQIEEIKKMRLANFAYLKKIFLELNFSPFFEASVNEVPGAFVFRAPGIDLDGFKIFMQSNGIESSVFYGEQAFYIPVHQHLSREDMDLFYLLTSHFIENGNK